MVWGVRRPLGAPRVPALASLRKQRAWQVPSRCLRSQPRRPHRQWRALRHPRAWCQPHRCQRLHRRRLSFPEVLDRAGILLTQWNVLFFLFVSITILRFFYNFFVM